MTKFIVALRRFCKLAQKPMYSNKYFPQQYFFKQKGHVASKLNFRCESSAGQARTLQHCPTSVPLPPSSCDRKQNLALTTNTCYFLTFTCKYFPQHPPPEKLPTCILTLILRRSRTGTVWFYTSPTMLPAFGRQHRGGCITPQAVTHSLVLLKMGKIISRNMLS